MNPFAQSSPAPTHPSPTDTVAATPRTSSPPPPLIVGTTQGLLILDPEPQVELEAHAITALATRANDLWVITDNNAIWQRSLHQPWRKLASVNDVRLHCLLPVQDTVLVGTAGACLVELQNHRIQQLTCFESVAGREDWYTPWGAPPDVRSQAISPSGILYVNVHVGGILRSMDQGQTWQPTIDFHADVHQVCTVPDRPDWVLAATAQGLAISEDQGETWRCDRTNLHAAYARAVAVCSETILMTASTGPRTQKSAIYRRPLHPSGTFKKCEQGLPEWFSSNINTGTLATMGHFAAFGTQEGDIFFSQDTGLSWQQVATRLAAIQCLAMIQVIP